MAAKKLPLPEKNVTAGKMINHAKEAVKARTEIAGLQGVEDKAKSDLAVEAVLERIAEEKNLNYIGLIRVVDENSAPVRVEFRMDYKAAGLDVSEEAVLDRIFGANRPVLFAKEQTITAIADPLALINELKAKGLNPMNYLSISIKDGMDAAIAEISKNVVKEERVMPQDGFLNNLNNVRNSMTDEAKGYISTYLGKVLKPTVVLGTKGKA